MMQWEQINRFHRLEVLPQLIAVVRSDIFDECAIRVVIAGLLCPAEFPSVEAAKRFAEAKMELLLTERLEQLAALIQGGVVKESE